MCGADAVMQVGPGAATLAVNTSAALVYQQPGRMLGAAGEVRLCQPTGLALMSDGSGIFISDICTTQLPGSRCAGQIVSN